MRIGICHVIIRDTLDWERTSYDQLISPFIRETARLWIARSTLTTELAGRASRA